MITETMKTALVTFHKEGHFGTVRKTTVQGLERRNLINREGDKHTMTKRGTGMIAELISSPARASRLKFTWHDLSTRPTKDPGTTDYNFWDAARMGRAQGMSRSGLFLKALCSKKAAWVMGKQPMVRCDTVPDAERELWGWLNTHYADVVMSAEESYNLGDYYLVVNGDLSLTVIPPQVVKPLVDEADYSRFLGWRISETYENPTSISDKMTVTDEYTATERVRTVQRNGVNVSVQRFRSPIGMIPVIHVPNKKKATEFFGHAEGEAALTALQNYDEVLDNALVGNRKQGRPTPVFEKMGTADNIKAFWNQFGTTRTQTLPDGTTETYDELEMSGDDAFTLGGDATFKYAQPGSFTADTLNILQILFYLILQHTEIPEFVWGNAIASSQASAETQMPAFTKWIEKEQQYATGWILNLAKVVLGFMVARGDLPRRALTDRISVQWESLTTQDERLTLDAIKLGLEKAILSDETALALMPLDIEDPLAELEKVKVEIERKREEEAALMPNVESPAPDDLEDIEEDELEAEVA